MYLTCLPSGLCVQIAGSRYKTVDLDVFKSAQLYPGKDNLYDWALNWREQPSTEKR